MRKLSYVISVLVILTCIATPGLSESLRQNQTWPSRVYPGNQGFPDHLDLLYFGSLLDGREVTPYDPTYLNESTTHNVRVIRAPGLIVVPSTLEDIQRAVLFARQRNLHLTIRSSGHDYIGRSTHDGSLNLNMKEMKAIKVDMNSLRNPAGEVTVESGASWLEVYTEVDKVQGLDATGQKMVGRVVVGGSAHTVAMGGYTQGGGHSPICRQFSLAADNLLEARIVTVDGKLHTVNSTLTITRDLDGTETVSQDTSLFWAIRGGGGGTWGVVVEFTFKLHYAPERFRNVLIVIPTRDVFENAINKDKVELALKTVNSLSPEWGGYFMTSSQDVPNTMYTGSLTLFLNHQGTNSSASNKEIDPLFYDNSVIYKLDNYYPTFLQYEINAQDPDYYTTYIFNSLIQPSSITNQTKLTEYVDLLYDLMGAGSGCTGAMIGGNSANVPKDSTPIHPGFRSGIMSMSCGVSWNGIPGIYDEATIEKALTLAQRLYTFGNGSYINEPAEDIPDWKTKFWNDDQTYQRLLDVKKKVDPDNYLWCHNCVGSDLDQGYAARTSPGRLPGEPAKDYFQTSVQFDQIKSQPESSVKPTGSISDLIIG